MSHKRNYSDCMSSLSVALALTLHDMQVCRCNETQCMPSKHISVIHLSCSVQHKTLICNNIWKLTCPEALDGAEEPRRGAVAPPVALIDHWLSSALPLPLLLVVMAALLPKLARPPCTPDLLSIVDLRGTWLRKIKSMCGCAAIVGSRVSSSLCLLSYITLSHHTHTHTHTHTLITLTAPPPPPHPLVPPYHGFAR